MGLELLFYSYVANGKWQDRHRRIRYVDVSHYKQHIDEQRSQALDELAA
jgi:hypothetical protein